MYVKIYIVTTNWEFVIKLHPSTWKLALKYLFIKTMLQYNQEIDGIIKIKK